MTTVIRRANPVSVLWLVVLAACLSLATGATWAKSSPGNAAAKKAATAMQDSASHQKPAQKAEDVLATSENLAGTITYVDSSDHEVTLTGANGIPYDFQLTNKTQVEVANKKISKQEVESELQKHATIRFVPTARGNVADSISIG